MSLNRGSFIIELREKSFAHNTNLSIIAAFQSKSSFPTWRKKKPEEKEKKKEKGELNYKISERLERRILRKRCDVGKAGSVYAKPARRKGCKDSRQGIKKKEREKASATVQNDVFRQLYPRDFSLYAHLRGTASHRALSAPSSLSSSIPRSPSVEMLNYKNNGNDKLLKCNFSA